MSFKYEQQLEDIIARQKEEITRLFERNAELQRLNDTICEETVEQARAEGQEEAWELARRIVCSHDYSGSELKEIFGNQGISWCISSNTYTEAAAKVAEWEQKNEEICVGDVLLSNETGNKCIVTRISNEVVTTLWNDGSCGDRPKDFVRGRFKKIGHIDVDAFLKQIGGGSDE